MTCRQKIMPDRPGFGPVADAVGFTLWVISLSSRGRPGVLGTSQQRITDLHLLQVHWLPIVTHKSLPDELRLLRPEHRHSRVATGVTFGQVV